MADISKIKALNGTTYDIKDVKARMLGVYYVEGPSTDNTAGTWTGVIDGLTQYYDGLSIIYVPAIAGASTTTLNINGLGAKTCYYTDTSKLTTQYAVGTPILLTYHADAWRRADYTKSGTITGITMNGVSKGTSGVVNLGTVLTAHQSIEHLAPKASPVFTGSISLGRKANSVIGTDSFAVGTNVTASAQYSHAEGNYTTASGVNSHAEGNGSTASNISSHAEGYRGSASGGYSHAEGDSCTASGEASHAEGSYTTASGMRSHAEGYETIASHAYQHVFGTDNIRDTSTAANTAKGNYIEIVGNGTSSALSNARTLDWSGNERLKGTLYVNANADGSGGKQVLSRGTTWGDLKGT